MGQNCDEANRGLFSEDLGGGVYKEEGSCRFGGVGAIVARGLGHSMLWKGFVNWGSGASNISQGD